MQSVWYCLKSTHIKWFLSVRVLESIHEEKQHECIARLPCDKQTAGCSQHQCKCLCFTTREETCSTCSIIYRGSIGWGDEGEKAIRSFPKGISSKHDHGGEPPRELTSTWLLSGQGPGRLGKKDTHPQQLRGQAHPSAPQLSISPGEI